MPRRTVVAHPDFGRKLKELREQHGLSLRRLGGMIHCSHGHLWDLESGIKRPSLSVAVLLDQALEAGGQLSAMVSEVSADTDARPVALEQAVVSMPSGLEFALDWRHGIDVAVDLWRGDLQRRNLLRRVGFSATAFPACGDAMADVIARRAPGRER